MCDKAVLLSPGWTEAWEDGTYGTCGSGLDTPLAEKRTKILPRVKGWHGIWMATSLLGGSSTPRGQGHGLATGIDKEPSPLGVEGVISVPTGYCVAGPLFSILAG